MSDPSPQSPPKSPAPPASFFYLSCQWGAEPSVKRELLRRRPDARLAFSLPGFLTFKWPQPESECEDFLPSAFARGWGWSRGMIKADTLPERLEKLRNILAGLQFDRLHVWPRDVQKPGSWDYCPGIQEADRAVWKTIAEFEPRCPYIEAGDDEAPLEAKVGEKVADVVLLSPTQWFVGFRTQSRRCLPWPGGLSTMKLPEHAVSRAYLKMWQGLEWSRLPLKPGQLACELGSSPGGASQALLDRGLRVMGVDPADMDPIVAVHARFRHIRRRSPSVPKAMFRPVRWLFADMNVAPGYTLDAVEAIVARPESRVRGILLTLKLSDWELAEQIPEYVERVKGWGFESVRVRQLQQHRQEVAITARRRPPVEKAEKAERKKKKRGDEASEG